MALDRETVGLIFKLEADSKQASAELDQFKKKIGDTSKESAAIARESFTTLSSEIIESFGVDGDIANSVASSMLKIQKSTLVAIGAFGGLAIGAGVVVGGLLSLAKSTTETVTEIGDLAEKTQLSTETISAFRIALQDGNSSLSTFEGAVSSLQEKMTAARLGNAGLAREFRQLGIDINQGTEPALRQIITRYNQLPQGAERTAFATRLFGSAGEDLVLTLNSLEGDLDGYTAKLRELGLIVTPDAVASAKQFDDQMKLLDRQLEGLKVTLGNLVIPAFTAWTTTINVAGKAIRDLVNGTNAASISITKLFGALLLGSNAATANLIPKLFEGELPTTDTGTKTPLPQGFGARGKKRGAKPDEASREELQRLKLQLAEEERLYREQAAALRRTFEQREIDEGDFVRQQIAALEKRLAAETAILAKERAVVEKSRFSKEDKQTKLEEIATKEVDLARQTASEIEKINDDSRKRLEQQGIQLAEAQVRTTEAMLSRKAALIRTAAEQERISLREAEAQLGEIYRQSAEERLALANAELTRAGENTRAREIATERIKALEIELAAITEQTAARIEEARKRDVESLIRKADELRRIREDQLINEGFSEVDAVAIAAMETLLNRPLSAMETLRIAFRATVEDLKSQVPSLIAVFTQMRDAIAGSLGAIIASFVSGRSSLRQAAAAMFAAALQPLKDYLLKKAKAQFALGLAELAMLNFGGAAKHFLAGAALSAAAGLIDVGSSAIAGSGAAAGATAPAGVGGRTDDRGARVIEQGDRRRPEPQIIIIRAETEPGVIVNRVIEDYKSNGPTRSVLRTDMLGASA